MSGGEDLADREQKSEWGRNAANARWSKGDHPLFMREEGERTRTIAWISIRRYTANGPVDAPRVWPAGELQSDDDIFAYFGGGTYELIAREALPDGKPGARIKTRRMTLDGPPKPFIVDQGVPAQSAPAAAPTHAPGTDMMQMFIALMADDRKEARAREERRDAEMRAAEERRQARDDARSNATTALIVQGFQAASAIVGSILAKPAPAATPPTDLMPLVVALMPKGESDPLDRLGKILEFAKGLRPEEKKTESLGQLMEGFGQAMGGIAQLEGMRIEAAKAGALSPPPTPGSPSLPSPQPTANGNAHPTSPAPPPTLDEENPEGEAATLAS